jgi:hypothetical protein
MLRVIAKVLRGNNARRLLYYLYGPGRANEHTDPHLVAGFADPADLEPERRRDGTRDFRRLAGLLAQPPAALAGPGYAKPVWHCAVRAAPADRMLSDAEWGRVAAQIMDRTGLAPASDDQGVRWVAVRHAADHVHMLATLARQDGTRPRIWNDFYRVREACQQAELGLGLCATAPADRTAARRATRAETEQSARRGWDEPPRLALRREVSIAAAGARTEQEFYARLQKVGVLVRERRSTINPDAVTGYAVGLPQNTASGGGVIWYSGGKLAADLTLPKLRRRWTAPSCNDPFSGPGLSRSAARAALRSLVTGAADQATDEAGFFARLREEGALVRLRFSDDDPGHVTGYSVTLPGHAAHEGAALWYGGGRLAANLMLPCLRERWGHPRNAGPGRSGAFRFTAPERNAIYENAARHAGAASEHIRRCARGDPSGAADAASAAADTLHVAARALRNPALRCAADAYGRAARVPHGRVPQRTRQGDQLRATARLVALMGNASGDRTLASIALIANLAALATAVAELRQAQQHAAQAAAARAAAAQLHATVTQARSAGSRRGQSRERRRSGPGSPDAPCGHFQVRPVATGPVPAQRGLADRRPIPHHGPISPQRAGPAP